MATVIITAKELRTGVAGNDFDPYLPARGGQWQHQHHQFPLRGRPRPYPEGIHSVAGNSRQNQCKINLQQQSGVGTKATGSSEKREATQNYTIPEVFLEKAGFHWATKDRSDAAKLKRGPVGKGENEKTLSTPLTLLLGKGNRKPTAPSTSYQGPALGQQEVRTRQSVRAPCASIWALTCVPTSEQEVPRRGAHGC